MRTERFPNQAFRNRFLGWSGDLETIVPALFRTIKVPWQRQRIELPDGDFIDLDHLRSGSRRLIVLFHGLEGSSESGYIKSFARFFTARQWDVTAVNFRSCSGELNRLKISYHSGKTDDVHTLMTQLSSSGDYDEMVLVGFSLGGNVLLKYLGEYQHKISELITRSAAFSVPVDLKGSAEVLSTFRNRFYLRRFLNSLEAKMKAKSKQFSDFPDISGLDSIRTFPDFDDRFTAPIHGFKDASAYYRSASSLQYLSQIRIPTLLVNAKNDPFLSSTCYPETSQIRNLLVMPEYPSGGGHVGFSYGFPHGKYYSELRLDAFLREQI